MKFVVGPQNYRGVKPCVKFITMCALCSEDKRFCPGPGPIEA